MRQWIAKLLGAPVLVLFLNLVFLLGYREVFSNIFTLLPIAFFNGFLSGDIVIRPISKQKDEYKKSVLVLSFLSMPLLCAAPYWEHLGIQSITPGFWDIPYFVVGITVLILGGSLAITARIQIGRFGGPKIVIEEDHKLLQTGVYRFIRHPMYTGYLLLFTGYGLSFGSIIAPAGFSVGLFVIFRDRINLEERLLKETFGDQFLAYLQHTWRLFPFIY